MLRLQAYCQPYVLFSPPLRRQNKITHLPSNLDALSGLQVLSVSSNLLEELPDAVAGLHR